MRKKEVNLCIKPNTVCFYWMCGINQGPCDGLGTQKDQ